MGSSLEKGRLLKFLGLGHCSLRKLGSGGLCGLGEEGLLVDLGEVLSTWLRMEGGRIFVVRQMLSLGREG